MPILNVVASRALAGKTAIATGIARGLTAGNRVRLIRSGSGPAAEADAVTFADYLFAASPGRVVDAAGLTAADGEVIIVELDAGAVPASGAAVLAVRTELTEQDTALAAQLGDRLIGTIATNVPPAGIENLARDLTNSGLRPLAVIGEDQMLAAPSVGEIRAALEAEVLYQGENDNEVIEDVLLSPVYADPARPHFRRFSSKAVLTPFNKTDFALAAIDTRAACLIITGGRAPSPYVVDRAQGETTTVLLTDGETPETLSALSDVWLTSRFRGERKAEAIFSHLDGRVDFISLLRKLS